MSDRTKYRRPVVRTLGAAAIVALLAATFAPTARAEEAWRPFADQSFSSMAQLRLSHRLLNDLREVQGGFEIAAAEVEHVQHAEEPGLVEVVAALFRDRHTSVQGDMRRIAFAMHLH